MGRRRTEPEDFSQVARDRASRYHRPFYAATVLRLLLAAAVYLLLAAWPEAGGLGWAGGAAVWAACVIFVAGVVCLPLDLWRGQIRERRWGFSTQTIAGWLADWAKAETIAVVLAAAAWTATVGLGRAFPTFWVVPAAAAAAVAVLVLSFVAPVVLEPLFNRFEPLTDEHIADELRALADRAGVPVRDVLVADASKRTSKANAYVSGLGPTRRVVIWDTLLAAASLAELKLIVAHELGHRRKRHILKGTALGMVGAAAAVALLWLVLGTPQPRDFPLAALLFLALELAGLPLLAWTSRRWERAADRYSLELTGDRDAFIRTHIRLATSNLSDLEPPRLAYLMLFTHPTPPERLKLARTAEPQPKTERVSVT